MIAEIVWYLFNSFLWWDLHWTFVKVPLKNADICLYNLVSFRFVWSLKSSWYCLRNSTYILFCSSDHLDHFGGLFPLGNWYSSSLSLWEFLLLIWAFLNMINKLLWMLKKNSWRYYILLLLGQKRIDIIALHLPFTDLCVFSAQLLAFSAFHEQSKYHPFRFTNII